MKQNTFILDLPNENSTYSLGEHIAKLCPAKAIIYLHGELGSGKTTFVRGFLHGKGYFSKVKSPTYTLVETYAVNGGKIYHLDLYRLKTSEELEFLGIRDYVNKQCILLIEWPELGIGFLPAPTLDVKLEFLEQGRKIILNATDIIGQEILDKFEPKKEYRAM